MADSCPGMRYTCTLSQELLDKAVNELNEPRDNAKRLKAIDKLREAFLKKATKLTLIRNDDGFLLRFLRAKKFNQEKALKMLINYHTVRKDVKEVFERVDKPTLLRDSLKTGFCYVMPEKDKQGRSVMIYRDGMIGGDCEIADLLALFILGLEKELEEEEVQINGLVTIEDMKDLDLRLMAKMTTSVMRQMTFITTDAMPMRYKMMHMVNEGKIFDFIFKMFKPFVKQKLLDRIQLHGKDYSKLHEDIDRKHLPTFLGGEMDNFFEEAIKWGEDLLAWKEKESEV